MYLSTAVCEFSSEFGTGHISPLLNIH